MIRLRKRALLLALGMTLVSVRAESCDPGARVFFIRPLNGATVTSPVRFIFGAELVDVKAPPEGQQGGNTGHHDLLVNLDAVPVGIPIPTDRQHLHFDQGQSRGDIDLPPGNYTFTLQFADGAHRSHGPDVSASIHVTVVQ
jgi:hypothetical protein